MSKASNKDSEKKSFVLYHDIRKPLELLSDAQRGKLFLAILDYSEYKNVPSFNDAGLEMAFAFIRNSIDRDAEAWEEKRRARAESGAKGGKQTAANKANASFAEKIEQSQANQVNAAFVNQMEQNQANQAVPVPAPIPAPVPIPVPVINNGENVENRTDKSLEKAKKKKAEEKSFTPPSIEEVRAYCAQRQSSVDPVRFWEYFDAGGWIDSKGQVVKNWKQKLIIWEGHSNERGDRKNADSQGNNSNGAPKRKINYTIDGTKL